MPYCAPPCCIGAQGSGDYDSPIPQDPNKQAKAQEAASGGEAVATPRATGGGAEGAAEEEAVDTGEQGAVPHKTETSEGRAAAAKVGALRAAADAAEAVAQGAQEHVGGGLMRLLEKTAAATEAAAEGLQAAARPGLLQRGGALLPRPAGATPRQSKVEAGGSPRKLPWRRATADFHDHMNGRVHPPVAHLPEQADVRGAHIKTSERPTPFTGWGLPRDRCGQATEIGYESGDRWSFPCGGAGGGGRGAGGCRAGVAGLPS